MKAKFLLFGFLYLSLTACQKEINDSTLTPGGGGSGPGGGGGGVIADTLVKKITIKSPGFPADSSKFSYDINKRLIKEEFNGNIYGVDQKVVTNIARNSAGIITGYTRISTNTSGQVIETETAVIKYDVVSSHYVSKVVNYSPASFLSAGDSILYTYNGNTPAMMFQYSKATVTDPYDSVYKITWTSLSHTDAWRYNHFNGWYDHKEFYLGPAEKKNPLYAPEVGLVVGFTLNIVEDDNFDWNLAAMISGNLITTVTYSGQYANFTYTYSGNYPLTRSYVDLGTTVNTMTFSY